MPILNLTQTAGATAQDILPAFHSSGGFILTPQDEDGYIQFGSNASPTNGEKVYKGSPTKFSYHEFPGLNARVSYYSATTGAKFTLRPIS